MEGSVSTLVLIAAVESVARIAVFAVVVRFVWVVTDKVRAWKP